MSAKPTLQQLVQSSLQTLLRETLMRADGKMAYLLNPNDPGLLETLQALSAEQVSTPPGPGRKPIVSHANHVLYGLDLVNRALHGDMQAFANADWDVAWKLERVDADEWNQLCVKLNTTVRSIVDVAPSQTYEVQEMFTGVYACAAHAAYHLGAIRQILLDIQPQGSGRNGINPLA